MNLKGRVYLIGVICFALSLTSVPVAFSQDAVPREILQRTLHVKVPNGEATGFEIDYKGKIYLVTARHVVAGLSTTGVTLQVEQSKKWIDYKTVRTLLPPSDNADIAVLETSKPFSTFAIKPSDDSKGEGPTFGQPVWFLGYPYGIGSQLANMQLPFIKRGTMSAVDATDPNAIVVYIDGFNNPGFSGGPIIYYDFKTHEYRILGVVKGYRGDSAAVSVKGQPADIQVLVNSGILIGYSIKHALQAIDTPHK
jgi:S1-C subfamily serine protease